MLVCLFFFLGGSGFLGQHIVRVLQERDPLIKEIRILDLIEYENKLGMTFIFIV